jgi:hypothetical protein
VVNDIPPGTTLDELPALFDRCKDRTFEAGYLNAVVSVIVEQRARGELPSDREFARALNYCKDRYRRIVHKLAAENQVFTFGPRPKGEATRSHKIKEFTARVILRLPMSLTNEELGPVFGISPEQVGRIRRRQAWPHLPSVEPLPRTRKIPVTKSGGLPLSQKQARLARMLRCTRPRRAAR